MIELKDFVSEVLYQLSAGVKDAQSRTKDLGAVIVPRNVTIGQSLKATSVFDSNNHQRVSSSVQFDIALVASDTEGRKTHIGVVGGFFGAGATGEAADNQQRTHRVTFSVPIFLPLGED